MATITISLPDQFVEQVDDETRVQGFSTRSEFVRSLLRRYFAKNEAKFEVFEPLPIDEVRSDLSKTGKYSQKFIDSLSLGLEKSSIYAGKAD